MQSSSQIITNKPTPSFLQAGCPSCRPTNSVKALKRKGKEVDFYSAFIKVPYTQGAQVRITQCYLQTTPYLPLPRKRSPDGASQTEVADIYLQPTTHLSNPKGWKAELAWVAGYAMSQFTCPKAVTHPSTNRARCRATALIETNALPLHQTADIYIYIDKTKWHVLLSFHAM